MEFFFIVTGFLMAQSVCVNYNSNKKIPVGLRTWSYLKKKLSRIAPFYLFAYGVTFLIWAFVCQYGFLKSVLILGNSMFQIGMVEMAGSQHYGFYMNGTWYISAMLIAIFIIYPFLSSNYDLYVRIITPILFLAYLFYGFQYEGGVCMVTKVIGIVYQGTIRALADISLGCLSFEICRNIRGRTERKWILSLLEIISYTVVIFYACFHGYSNFDFTAVVLICIGIILTFSSETYLYRLCNGKLFLKSFFCFLGKLSLPIYLTHLLLVQLLFPHIVKQIEGYGKIVWLYILLVILTALVFHIFMDKLILKGRKMENGI